MRAMDTIGLLYLPDYTTASISSAITFLTKGWVEVESCEAAGLTSLLEVLQVGSQEVEEERRRWVEAERRRVEEESRGVEEQRRGMEEQRVRGEEQRLGEQGLGLEEEGHRLEEQGLGMEVQGLGLGEQGLGLEVQGLGLEVQGLGLGEQELGLGEQELGLGEQGLGLGLGEHVQQQEHGGELEVEEQELQVEVQGERCEECNKHFSSKSKLKEHFRNVHKDPEECEICAKWFSSKKAKARHMKRSHDQETFMCPYCPKSFTRKDNVSRHIETVHRTIPTITCKKCGYKFSRTDLLLKHMLTVHKHKVRPSTSKLKYLAKLKNRRRVICSTCATAYSNKYALSKHIKKVHGDAHAWLEGPDNEFLLLSDARGGVAEKVACENCDFECNTKMELRKHKEVKHKGELVFNCDQCVKSVKSFKCLREHKSKKHRGQVYRCRAVVGRPGCGKLLSTKEGLKKHMARCGRRPSKEFSTLSRSGKAKRAARLARGLASSLTRLQGEERSMVVANMVKTGAAFLDTCQANPLDEDDLVEIVTDNNLSDKQLLKIVTRMRKKWGRKVITSKVKQMLKKRKSLLSHLFTVERLGEDDEVHFEDKDGLAITRHLVFCTDLVALTEAREAVEDGEFDHVLGIDDGKELLKVGLEIIKETSKVFLVAMIVERHSVQTSSLQVTWNAIKKGALPARGAGKKEGRGVKHTIVIAAVRKVKETYKNLSVIMEKLQVTAMNLFLVFP